MNWHDILEVNGQQVPVEPVAGALVETYEDVARWTLLQQSEFDDPDDSDEPPTIVLLDDYGGEINWNDDEYAGAERCCTPILPAVPPGLTCWDVLRSHPDTYENYFLKCMLALELGVVIFREDSKHVYSYKNAISTDAYPAHMRDMQKYGALLDWIKVNSNG